MHPAFVLSLHRYWITCPEKRSVRVPCYPLDSDDRGAVDGTVDVRELALVGHRSEVRS